MCATLSWFQLSKWELHQKILRSKREWKQKEKEKQATTSPSRCQQGWGCWPPWYCEASWGPVIYSVALFKLHFQPWHHDACLPTFSRCIDHRFHGHDIVPLTRDKLFVNSPCEIPLFAPRSDATSPLPQVTSSLVSCLRAPCSSVEPVCLSALTVVLSSAAFVFCELLWFPFVFRLLTILYFVSSKDLGMTFKD